MVDNFCRSDTDILRDVFLLKEMWHSGALGGENMPEDVHPLLPTKSADLLHYFTLGMCLNYQRNSYTLWQACTAAFERNECAWIFQPSEVAKQDIPALSARLLEFKVALQPRRHPEIWHRNCQGIVKHFGGDLRNLLSACSFDLVHIRSFVQAHKGDFPYLGGPKLCNYWLYVLTQYTDFHFENRAALSVAPDRHVMKASQKLGLISMDELHQSGAAPLVAARWESLLSDTDLAPIDVHTPLWLWSRSGFKTMS